MKKRNSEIEEDDDSIQKALLQNQSKSVVSAISSTSLASNNEKKSTSCFAWLCCCFSSSHDEHKLQNDEQTNVDQTSVNDRKQTLIQQNNNIDLKMEQNCNHEDQQLISPKANTNLQKQESECRDSNEIGITPEVKSNYEISQRDSQSKRINQLSNCSNSLNIQSSNSSNQVLIRIPPFIYLWESLCEPADNFYFIRESTKEVLSTCQSIAKEVTATISQKILDSLVIYTHCARDSPGFFDFAKYASQVICIDERPAELHCLKERLREDGQDMSRIDFIVGDFMKQDQLIANIVLIRLTHTYLNSRKERQMELLIQQAIGVAESIILIMQEEGDQKQKILTMLKGVLINRYSVEIIKITDEKLSQPILLVLVGKLAEIPSHEVLGFFLDRLKNHLYDICSDSLLEKLMILLDGISSKIGLNSAVEFFKNILINLQSHHSTRFLTEFLREVGSDSRFSTINHLLDNVRETAGLPIIKYQQQPKSPQRRDQNSWSSKLGKIDTEQKVQQGQSSQISSPTIQQTTTKYVSLLSEQHNSIQQTQQQQSQQQSEEFAQNYDYHEDNEDQDVSDEEEGIDFSCSKTDRFLAGSQQFSEAFSLNPQYDTNGQDAYFSQYSPEADDHFMMKGNYQADMFEEISPRLVPTELIQGKTSSDKLQYFQNLIHQEQENEDDEDSLG